MSRWLNRSVTLVLTALIGWGMWSVLHWLLLAGLSVQRAVTEWKASEVLHR